MSYDHLCIFDQLITNNLSPYPMKRILMGFLLCLLLVWSGQAQDRIVTWNNDTIPCTITNSGARYIRFTVYQNGIQTNGRLNRTEIKQIIQAEKAPVSLQAQPEFHRWRVALSGGLSYLTGDTDPARDGARQQGLTNEQADDYFQQLLLGWQSSAQVHFFLDSDLAFGLHYRFHTSQADVFATFDPQDGMNLYHGQMKETIYTHYIGPSVFGNHQLSANQKWWLNGSFSAGIAFYRDELSVLNSGMLLTGKAFGATLDMGLEYFVAPRVSVGLNLGLFVSNLTKVTMDDGYNQSSVKLEEEERQNLSSLDVSTGLRFYF